MADDGAVREHFDTYWEAPPNMNGMRSADLLKLPDAAFLAYMTVARAFRETVYGVAAARTMRWPLPIGGGAALDFGCGVGFDAVTLSELGWRVDLFDIVHENVLVARRWHDLLFGRTSHVVDGTGDLPLGNRYDLIIAYGVLHHIRDPHPITEWMRGVLADDGEVIVMLYTRDFVPQPNERTDGVRESSWTVGYDEEGARRLFGDGWIVECGPVWNRGRFMRVRSRRVGR